MQMHAWAEICHPLQSSKSPSQDSHAALAQESLTRPGFLQSLHAHQQHSAILHNNYISLLSDLCACVHVKKKNGVVMEATVLQWAVRIASRVLEHGRKRWSGALLSEKCWCFVRNHRERVTQIWTSPSEEERKTFWLSGDFLVLYFRDAFATGRVVHHENTQRWHRAL